MDTFVFSLSILGLTTIFLFLICLLLLSVFKNQIKNKTYIEWIKRIFTIVLFIGISILSLIKMRR